MQNFWLYNMYNMYIYICICIWLHVIACVEVKYSKSHEFVSKVVNFTYCIINVEVHLQAQVIYCMIFYCPIYCVSSTHKTFCSIIHQSKLKLSLVLIAICHCISQHIRRKGRLTTMLILSEEYLHLYKTHVTQAK